MSWRQSGQAPSPQAPEHVSQGRPCCCGLSPGSGQRASRGQVGAPTPPRPAEPRLGLARGRHGVRGGSLPSSCRRDTETDPRLCGTPGAPPAYPLRSGPLEWRLPKVKPLPQPRALARRPPAQHAGFLVEPEPRPAGARRVVAVWACRHKAPSLSPVKPVGPTGPLGAPHARSTPEQLCGETPPLGVPAGPGK